MTSDPTDERRIASYVLRVRIGLVSMWVWWAIAIVLGVSFQAAHKAHQLRHSRQLANARVVA